MQATGRFLGQFSAVDRVELRAQVGGTLSTIEFQDGQIVHKGDPLFVIDPRPFQIKLDQAVAQLQTAQAKEALSEAELWRAQQLKRTDFGTAENVDQRAADQRSAQAAIDTAKAAISDAQLDLEFSRVTAPFTGRIGAHLVSVGSLVSGSRGGTSPTTLLATIVSLDPIYLDFDMSEVRLPCLPASPSRQRAPHDDVAISLDGDGHFDRHGTLDFIDNAVNRSSGTIHARATVPNPDLTHHARAVRAPSRRARPARAGPAGARRRCGPRPVAADRDDRGGGWHGRSEGGRDRRSVSTGCASSAAAWRRTTASSSMAWCASARGSRSRRSPARSRPIRAGDAG